MQDAIERRSKMRYPIRLSVQYRGRGGIGGGVVGAGQTLDLSSSGILVESAPQQKIKAGSRLEVSVEWPIKLDGTAPLQVVILGRVVRSEAFRFAVALQRYDFRTMKRGQDHVPLAKLAAK